MDHSRVGKAPGNGGRSGADSRFMKRINRACLIIHFSRVCMGRERLRPHHVRTRAHSTSPKALLSISKGNHAPCQRHPAFADVAGGTVLAGNSAGVTVLLTLGLVGTFTTTSTPTLSQELM